MGDRLVGLEPPVIAIDGPAAGGKGTVARKLAEFLEFRYLDSGLLYRALAAESVKRGAEPDSDEADSLAEKLCKQLLDGARQHPEWDGATLLAETLSHPEEVLKSPETTEATSKLARRKRVREALLPVQRIMRRPPGLVTDGRDMGSKVFPNATLKVYLTASQEERARRRKKELEERGLMHGKIDVLAALNQRDERDSTRDNSPLVKVPGAFYVDSSDKSPDQVVAELADHFAVLLREAGGCATDGEETIQTGDTKTS